MRSQVQISIPDKESFDQEVEEIAGALGEHRAGKANVSAVVRIAVHELFERVTATQATE